MSKSVTPSARVVDLSAYRAATRPREVAEVAGRLLHVQLLAEAHASIASGAVFALGIPSVVLGG